MENLTLGILFGIISMIGYGISNAVSKKPTKKIGSIKSIFIRGVFLVFILSIIFVFTIKNSTFSLYYILIAIGISLIGYFPLWSLFKALKNGKVGVVMPVASSSVILTVLLSIIFFNESLSFIQSIAILSILIGLITISIKIKDFKNSDLLNLKSGVPYALLTCLLWGLIFALIKIPISVIGPIMTSLIMETGILIISCVHMKIKNIRFSINNIDKKTLLQLAIVSIGVVFGSIFFNYSIKVSAVSIAAPLSFSSPIISSLYGKIVYREKLRKLQWFAVLFILLGIILISVFS